MAWSAPNTAVAGAFNAADFNTYIRDNLNETMPALATDAGQWFCSDGANSLVAREIRTDYVAADENTSSTTYTDLTTVGPSITMDTGAFVIVSISAQLRNGTTNAAAIMDFAISGATTRGAQNESCLMSDGLANDNANYKGVSTGLAVTPGTNTFTVKYRAGSGNARFVSRRMTVWSF